MGGGNSPMSRRDEEGRTVIRALIDKLEQVKDSIIGFFERAPIRDAATREMWTADAKEAFFDVVAAYDMLRSGPEEPQAGRSGSVSALLEMAKSRVKQVSSELKTFKNRVADDLILRLEETFDAACNAISARAGTAPQDPATRKTWTTITKVGEGHYALNCSSCGQVAAVFRVEVPRLSTTGEKAILYKGITKSTHFDMANEKTIFESLERGDLRGLNDYMETMTEGGLDAYCPSCDKAYCKEHCNTEEEWDEGFYDCTYGTCAEGHRRLLDD